MAYAQFPSTEIDGYNPYRLAKETMADFQIGFVMTKGMPWNEQIDKALQNIIEAGWDGHIFSIMSLAATPWVHVNSTQAPVITSTHLSMYDWVVCLESQS